MFGMGLGISYQNQSTPLPETYVPVELGQQLKAGEGMQLILAFHFESPKIHSWYHAEAARPPRDQIRCSPRRAVHQDASLLIYREK